MIYDRKYDLSLLPQILWVGSCAMFFFLMQISRISEMIQFIILCHFIWLHKCLLNDFLQGYSAKFSQYNCVDVLQLRRKYKYKYFVISFGISKKKPTKTEMLTQISFIDRQSKATRKYLMIWIRHWNFKQILKLTLPVRSMF